MSAGVMPPSMPEPTKLLPWLIAAAIAAWLLWPETRPPDPAARLHAIQAVRDQIAADRLRRSADIQATQLELPADARLEILALDEEAEQILRSAEDDVLRGLEAEERRIRER